MCLYMSTTRRYDTCHNHVKKKENNPVPTEAGGSVMHLANKRSICYCSASELFSVPQIRQVVASSCMYMQLQYVCHIYDCAEILSLDWWLTHPWNVPVVVTITSWNEKYLFCFYLFIYFLKRDHWLLKIQTNIIPICIISALFKKDWEGGGGGGGSGHN